MSVVVIDSAYLEILSESVNNPSGGVAGPCLTSDLQLRDPGRRRSCSRILA
jgi:hypothetical protein